jgi:hypothetical protein
MALVLLGTSVACTAAEPASLKTLVEARAVMDQAMALVVKDQVDDAFSQLRPYWAVPSNEIDTIVLKTVQQRNLASPRFGKTLGYGFVKEEKVGDFLARYTFVEKRELHALRWTFVLYKAKDSWAFNSVFWDDNLQGLF